MKPYSPSLSYRQPLKLSAPFGLFGGIVLNFVVWCVLLVLATVTSCRSHPPKPILSSLPLNQAIDMLLEPGQRRSYRVALQKGAYLKIVLVQREQDLKLWVDKPQGISRVVDSFSYATGSERLHLVADQSGEYVVTVEALEGKASRSTLTAFVSQSAETDRARALSQQVGAEALDLPKTEQRLAGLARAEKLARSAGDSVLEAEWITWQAWTYGGAKRSAEECQGLARSAMVFEQADEPARAAIALLGLGARLRELNNEDAMISYPRAMDLAQASGSPSLEARVRLDYGICLAGLGQVQQAILCYDRALRLIGENWPELRADLLGETAVAYGLCGRNELARSFLLEALPLLENRNPELRARLRVELGWTWFRDGRVDRAIAEYRDIQTHSQDLMPKYRAGLHDRLATALVAANRYQEAQQEYHKALALVETRVSRAHTLANLAALELRRGRPEESLRQANRAIDLFAKQGQPLSEAKVQLLGARAEMARGKDALALERLKLATDLFQTVRANVRTRTQSFALTEAHFDIIQDYADALIRWSRQHSDPSFAERAFEILAWARGLADGERLASVWEQPAVEADAPTRLRAIDVQIAALGEQAAQEPRLLERAEWLSEGGMGESKPGTLPLAEPQAVQRQLLEADDLLLCYVLGQQKSYVFALTRTTFEVIDLPAEPDIRFAVENYLQQLTRLRFNEAAETQYWGAQASRKLLAPLGNRLTGKRLLLVKDGVLHHLPFAALPEPGSAKMLLIDQHELVVLPSVTHALLAQQLGASRNGTPLTALAVVDPVYDSRDPRLAGKEQGARADGYERLPGTAREAEVLAGLLAGTELWTGFDANKSRIQHASLARYGLIHFGVHGELHAQHPSLSKLALSRFDRNGSAIDGSFFAREVAALHMPAELVVLSGCRTAQGRDYRGQGVWSLGRDFMSAGALRVLVSLWDVDDRATAELMIAFYQSLLAEGLRPGAALRAAQLKIRALPQLHLPYYWAAFELQGSPLPLRAGHSVKAPRFDSRAAK